MTDTEPEQGTTDLSLDDEVTTQAPPVRVPNVTPGAKSGLDHTVIGSAAQDAYDATQAAQSDQGDATDPAAPESTDPPAAPETPPSDPQAAPSDPTAPAAPEESTGDAAPSSGQGAETVNGGVVDPAPTGDPVTPDSGAAVQAPVASEPSQG